MKGSQTEGSDYRTQRQEQTELVAPFTAGDPELGVLRLQELTDSSSSAESDSELGQLRLRSIQTIGDPELGTIRVRQLRLPPWQLEAAKFPPPQLPSTVYLFANIGYFQTNNIFSGVDPVEDGLISTGLTLLAVPSLGPQTDLVAAIDGRLIRYGGQSASNYNQLRFRAGVRQQLTSRISGEIGWNNQQLFDAEQGDRFLDENSVRLAFYRRDRLNSRLRLDSVYELRLSFAKPDNRSRVINSLAVSLSYALQRQLQVGLDYQFGLSNFMQRQREDQYHRLLGRLSYRVSRHSQLSLQAGLSLGGSSEPNVDFDDFFFSVNYTLELGRF